jgi:hypothetical protein
MKARKNRAKVMATMTIAKMGKNSGGEKGCEEGGADIDTDLNSSSMSSMLTSPLFLQILLKQRPVIIIKSV